MSDTAKTPTPPETLEDIEQGLMEAFAAVNNRLQWAVNRQGNDEYREMARNYTKIICECAEALSKVSDSISKIKQEIREKNSQKPGGLGRQ